MNRKGRKDPSAAFGHSCSIRSSTVAGKIIAKTMMMWVCRAEKGQEKRNDE